MNSEAFLKTHFRYYFNYLKARTQLLLIVFIASCNGLQKETSSGATANTGFSKQLLQFPKYGFNSGFLDSKGTLWFSSNGGGIYKYDGASFTNYTTKDGLHSNQVYEFAEDTKGALWMGTQNGLSRYYQKTFTQVPIPFKDTTGLFLDKVYPILSPNAVHALSSDTKGNFWIGTAGGGAYYFDGKKFTSYLSEIGHLQEDSNYHNWIPKITEDAAGNTWFASMTHGGASKFDGTKFTHFLIKDGLSDDMVRTIFTDASGKIWFGFNGNRKSGLTSYDGTTFTSFSKEDGLCNAGIRTIYEDGRGRLWLGGDRGNLCVYDGETFQEFKTAGGSTIAAILFIIEDAEKNIWFGGKYGIWRLEDEQLTNMTQNTFK